MKTLIALTLAALLATSAAAQSPLTPEDFAYRSVISLSGAGPFHQVALPLAVYEGVTSADLADLRVFNGQGEVLPYALLRSENRKPFRAKLRARHRFSLYPRLARLLRERAIYR